MLLHTMSPWNTPINNAGHKVAEVTYCQSSEML